MKAYPKEPRPRVLDAVDRGMPTAETAQTEAAKTFGVAVSTIERYSRLRCETGGVPQLLDPRSTRAQTGGFGGDDLADRS